jgi:hypothetical protein
MNAKLWFASVAALLMAAPMAVGQQTTPTNQRMTNPASANQNPTTNQDYNNPNRDRMTSGALDRSNNMDAAAERLSYRSSELVGLKVRTLKDEEKGKIKDLVIGHDGRIIYAAVSFGGFLGVGDKLFAVPFEALHVVKNGDKVEFARVDVTEDTIKNRQGFDQDRWPEQADPSFLTGGPRNAARPAGGIMNTER